MKHILEAADLDENEKRILAALCDGPCSPDNLATSLGHTAIIQANGAIGRAGKKIYENAPVGSMVRGWYRKERKEGWALIVTSRLLNDGKPFLWEIRPEVRTAVIELGWYKPHTDTTAR